MVKILKEFIKNFTLLPPQNPKLQFLVTWETGRKTGEILDMGFKTSEL